MKRTSTGTHEPRLVWVDPLMRLLSELGTEAELLRKLDPGNRSADLIDATVGRFRKSIAEARAEWVPTDAAAQVLDITAAAVAARCRRTLREQGLAKKTGALWYVHASALERAA